MATKTLNWQPQYLFIYQFVARAIQYNLSIPLIRIFVAEYVYVSCHSLKWSCKLINDVTHTSRCFKLYFLFWLPLIFAQIFTQSAQITLILNKHTQHNTNEYTLLLRSTFFYFYSFFSIFVSFSIRYNMLGAKTNIKDGQQNERRKKHTKYIQAQGLS